MPNPRVVGEIQSALVFEALDPRLFLSWGAEPGQEVVQVTWAQFRASEMNIADYSLVVLVLDSYELAQRTAT